MTHPIFTGSVQRPHILSLRRNMPRHTDFPLHELQRPETQSYKSPRSHWPHATATSSLLGNFHDNIFLCSVPLQFFLTSSSTLCMKPVVKLITNSISFLAFAAFLALPWAFFLDGMFRSVALKKNEVSSAACRLFEFPSSRLREVPKTRIFSPTNAENKSLARTACNLSPP
jgi:hypothetical protein